MCSNQSQCHIACTMPRLDFIKSSLEFSNSTSATLGTMIITESMETLLSRASKFVVNKEVLDKLQESFASEILTIALIRAQFLNDERNNNIGVTSSGVSSIYGSSAYSAIATITGSSKDRSNSTSPVPYTSTPVNNSSDVLAQLPSNTSTTSLSASYNTNYSMDNAAKSGKGESSSVRTDDSVVSYRYCTQ